VIVAGCAPGERHEIGLLMVVVRLRWRGWDVKYLGAELSLERLAEALRHLQPRLLLFSATRPETARALAGLTAALQSLVPVPPVLFGGQGFLEVADAAAMPGATVHDGHEDVADLVERLVGSRPRSNGAQHVGI
jgi:methanogenic corrinoid protein MtbC1